MNRLFFVIYFLLALSFSASTVAEEAHTLIVAGTGDSQELLHDLASAFNQQQTQLRVEIPNSIGSKGGIRALIAGKVTMARTARSLKPVEAAKGLKQHLFTRAPVVFALHPSVKGFDSLSVEQLVGVYLGRYRNWQELGGPDHRIYLVEREPGDSARNVMERLLPSFNEKRNQGKIFYSTPEAAAAVAEHPYTIGYLPLPVARAYGLKVLAIDGVQPNTAGIRSGSYPYVTPFYLVTKGVPEGDAGRFLNFVYSDKGFDVIRRASLIPLSGRASGGQ